MQRKQPFCIDEFTKAIRESTKQMASHGMKMSNLREVLLGKADFNLTLIVL